MEKRGRTEFGQRMYAARKKAGLTQKQAATAVNLRSQGTIAELESTATGSSYVVALSRVYGCSADWLAQGVGEPEFERQDATESGPIPLDDNPEYPAIPRVNFKLAAGASGFEVQHMSEDADPIVFRREWYRSRGLEPANLYAVRVSGSSMEPGLWHGDTVVLNTADTDPKDGVVYGVNYEGELVVKRLVRDSGEWWLHSDNADQRRYSPKRCHADSIILGRVVHKQSEHI